jgi:hypothetical protein
VKGIPIFWTARSERLEREGLPPIAASTISPCSLAVSTLTPPVYFAFADAPALSADRRRLRGELQVPVLEVVQRAVGVGERPRAGPADVGESIRGRFWLSRGSVAGCGSLPRAVRTPPPVRARSGLTRSTRGGRAPPRISPLPKRRGDTWRRAGACQLLRMFGKR